MANTKEDRAVKPAVRRAKNIREGLNWISISHIRTRVNSFKRKKKKQVLKASNMGAEYAF